MEPFHPYLCFRPKRNPNLKRPSREHPVLGRIEYVNASGWQSLVDVSGHPVQLELQCGSRITEDEIEAGANFLTNVQGAEPRVREAAWTALNNETFLPALDRDDSVWLSITSANDAIFPHGLNVWSDNADLFYNFFYTEAFSVCTAFEIMVYVDKNLSLKGVSANQLSLSERAKRILKIPVPTSLAGFENSLPDQFVSRAAVWGWFKFDSTLHGLLAHAMAVVQTTLDTTSGDTKTYLLNVASILRLIARDDTPENA